MKSDYHRIADAIDFIATNSRRQPTLNDVATHLELSAAHFQRLFSRWAGVTPKKYLQILTVEHAKQLLSESKPLLAVSDEVGLSSGSRLYDHFVQLEAATPGEYKTGGAGLSIDYGVHNSPFGNIFVAATARGICKLSFLDQADITADITDLQRRWPNALLRHNAPASLKIIDRIFSGTGPVDRPLSLHVCGTNFQVNVWRALMQIPAGTLRSYSHIAKAVGKPMAARAVGSAIGSNPIAFFIPCHRVLQQSGNIGGYHWGLTRKHLIHAWESARG
ncbi:MAG: AraC family transcriptional regulator of adaptative response [Porticoccaceae bacterium]|jgi:AraC family transcriptional regulator of adaptative response/methylated-DNA-[protein]-cysteine methyltransferase